MQYVLPWDALLFHLVDDAAASPHIMLNVHSDQRIPWSNVEPSFGMTTETDGELHVGSTLRDFSGADPGLAAGQPQAIEHPGE
jgi:hypothetical protein